MRFRIIDTHSPLPPGTERKIRATVERSAKDVREVRLRLSGPHGGIDRTATLEADVHWAPTVVVSARDATPRGAIRLALRKLAASVARDAPRRRRRPRVAFRARGLARALGLSLVVAAAVLFAPDAHAESNASIATSGKSLTETIGSSKTMQTFAKLVEKAGLSASLNGKQPYTLLVPPESALAQVVVSENRTRLRALISNHIIAGRLEAGDLADRNNIRTLAGHRLAVAHKSGVLKVGSAVVKAANIPARNGLIHIVSTVLSLEKKTLVDIVKATGRHATLTDLIDRAGLTAVLSGSDAHTLFAPTDEAFARLPAETLQRLRSPAHRDELVAILNRHVARGRIYAEDALRSGQIRVVDGHEMLAGARLLEINVDAANGVLHVVDRILER